MSHELLHFCDQEFSDKKYHIRIYKVLVGHSVQETKYTFEIFSVAEPTVIFSADFFSQAHLQGKRLFVERFNLVQ